MAAYSMKLLSFFLILFLFLHVVAEAALEHQAISKDEENGEDVVSKAFYHPRINCKFACARRCSRARRRNLCRRACGTCCFRCHCVPPGTYGNQNRCPCYASLTTRGGRKKCP